MTHQLCLPNKITGTPAIVIQIPHEHSLDENSQIQAWQKRWTLSGPKQKSREGEFQGHWVICLPCVFVWLWEYGGGTTSDPWGVKGPRKRGEGGAPVLHIVSICTSSPSPPFLLLVFPLSILFIILHCYGDVSWRIIMGVLHVCTEIKSMYYIIKYNTVTTHWFCSLVQRNQERTRTETSWLHPHRYRHCNWERKGIKKRLHEAVWEWHPFNLQQSTWFLCVCMWWWGSQGSIQLINTSLHLSDANCRVQSLPSPSHASPPFLLKPSPPAQVA